MKRKTTEQTMPKLKVNKEAFDKVLGELIRAEPQKRSETKPVKQRIKNRSR